MATGDTVLILGAAGQIGTDLVSTLRDELGGANVIAADVKNQEGFLKETGPFEQIDVLDEQPQQLQPQRGLHRGAGQRGRQRPSDEPEIRSSHWVMHAPSLGCENYSCGPCRLRRPPP